MNHSTLHSITSGLTQMLYFGVGVEVMRRIEFGFWCTLIVYYTPISLQPLEQILLTTPQQ